MDLVQGFFSQNFVSGMLALVLIPFFLIVLYVMALYVRASRRVKKLSAAQASASAQTPPAPTGPDGLELLRQAREYSPDELPDLSLLLPEIPTAPPAPTSDARVTLHTGEQIEAVPVLQVMRDPRDGRLLVVMEDGTGYRSLVNAPEVRRTFTRVMKELSTVVTEADPLESAPAPAAPPAKPTPTPAEPELPRARDLLTTPAEPPAAPSAPPVPKVAGPLPGDLPSYKFDDNPAVIVPGTAGFKKVEFTPPPAVDIPSAIEAYLQWRLQTTGQFRGRQLHVLTAPGGGVRIRVDDNYYDFVDDIADPEAKAFIKQSIQEWQERQG
ncbi:hypothetical protein VZO05_08990 [Aggregatilineales bacterium SYSU G02658]